MSNTQDNHTLTRTNTSIDQLKTDVGSLDTRTLNDAISVLLEEHKRRLDADHIYIIWCTEDVKGRRPDLSDEQCREVLSKLKWEHDGDIGITLVGIESVAEHLFPEPDNLGELRQQYQEAQMR